ncbi:hypothetical protein A9G24_08725 [Gilliamella sp. App6-5]|uniref:RCC1 domain-containing protein n=1 Tax=Gilliamella sp. App6-5 TaxID=3120232 RepID=UPI00080E0B6A|nr:hypothetical protein [Gilliamella apicola]OCG12198.1 hypothetical protein A9G24_08725 [Gilliamella apicola]
MKAIKIMILFITYLSFPLVAKTRTDAVIFSTTTNVNITTRTNLIKTGVTLENGDVWVWGYRGRGLQGNGKSHVSFKAEPARVKEFIEKGLSITQLATGIYHIIALDDRGNVWGWGRNAYGEAAGHRKGMGYYIDKPVLILENKDVIAISCGKYSSYALTREGDVYSWGRSYSGESGRDIRVANAEIAKIPRQYFKGSKVVKIGTGTFSAYAINEKGEVFGWGDEAFDSFGFVNETLHVYNLRPKQITNLDGINGKDIMQITGGHYFTTFLTSTGRVYGMGRKSRLGLTGTITTGDEEGIVDDDHSEFDEEEDIEGGEEDEVHYGKELTPEEIEKENEKREGERRGKTIATPTLITQNISSLYCRFRGCVAITREKKDEGEKLLTWGIIGGAYRNILYGKEATLRNNEGKFVKLDGGRQHLFYWNDEGQVFGVGYGGGRKFDPKTSKKRDWEPAFKMEFVVDAMKKVYGEDYIPGQGK